MRESDLSPLQTVVATDSLEDLKQIVRRAGFEPTIARVESALPFLPTETEAVGQIRSFLGSISHVGATPLDRKALEESLAELEDALTDVSDEAFSAGFGALAASLEDARALAEELNAQVNDAPPASEAEWVRAQEELYGWTQGALRELNRTLQLPAPSISALPEAVRGRYLTANGRFLAYMHPTQSVFDEQFLDEYVAACKRVTPDVTGFPIVFHRMSGRITAGFYQAVAAGGALVFLLLLLDYRNLRHTLLAIVPLLLGILWMLGGMRLLGLSFNFANLVAVPLVIGVGIDNGVHIVHRVRLEGDRGMSVVLRHTGRAILIASLTTMIGFGSLALASHRGMASLGLVLLLGVGFLPGYVHLGPCRIS